MISLTASGQEPPGRAVSGEIALTSDYVYRGQTFSDGSPAIQAGATWSNAGAAYFSGLHVDGWASSIDFGSGDPADAELSATVGYEVPFEALTVDVGVTGIAYPGAPRGGQYEYVEIYGAATAPLSGGEFTGALHYAPRYSGDAGPALFADLEGSWPLGQGVSARVAVGHAHLDPRAGADYFYWQAGVAAEALGVTFDLRYHGNDARACIGSCADRVALTISRAF